MSVALAIGALTAMQAVTQDPLPMLDRSEPREACTVSLVLVGVDPTSTTSVLVDRLTGGDGFSHVYVDPCRELDGEPRVIDYTVSRGVHWASPDIYAERRRVRVPLDVVTGSELWGCVRARLGRPFRVGPMALANDSVSTCVGLVVSCLPGRIVERLHAFRRGPCLSPNTLARFFRVVEVAP